MLIESGVRVHLTTYERDKAQVPSNFTLKLRKHVRTRRIEKVEQLGADRVIVITCGSGLAEHKLVIELYDKVRVRVRVRVRVSPNPNTNPNCTRATWC